MLKMIKLVLIITTLVQISVVNAALPIFDSSGEALPTLAPMLKQINPAVVNISTFSNQKRNSNPLMNDPFFRRFFKMPDRDQQQRPQKRKQAAGSGVIVDAKNGYVVTNYHVIKDADEIRISLNNGKHYIAKKLGVDPELDIAVLKIDGEDLVAVKMADSSKLQVGDFVVAIGNPFALGQTVTTGIVSALGRTGLGIEGYENFIQTDASINPGNSGGALVNLRGELVGINTAIISPAGGNVGIGFSIPINMVSNSLAQIIADGEVKRGQIGVNIQDVTPELQDAFDLENGRQGVLVTNVLENSPAEDSGLEVDDIIIAINSEVTTSTGILRSQISSHGIDDEIIVTVLRDGEEKNITVKIGESTGDQDANGKMHELLEGIIFENADNAVLVKGISNNSIGAYSGLKVGDKIVGTNRHRVNNLDDFIKQLKLNEHKILLRIIRGRSSFYLVIQ